MQRILTILFLIYLMTSFGKNFISVCKDANLEELYNYSTNDLRTIIYEEQYNKMSIEEKQNLSGYKTVNEITDKEIEQVHNNAIKLVLFITVIFSLCITLFKNFFIVAIYIAIKVSNRKLKMEKLNKDDFNNNKQYYTKLLAQERNICTIVDWRF